MTLNGWLQIAVYLLAILAVTKPLGMYMTRVFARERTWLDPVLRPLERLTYRLTGVDEKHEMRWTEYAAALILFSVVSMIVLYLMQRLQGALPFNPQALGAVAPDLAFNTAASFTTNTNWQSYVPETTMSYLTQMAGLAYHNFVSAAAGIALAIAFIRGIAQREKADARQLLGRPDARVALGAAPVLFRRRPRPGISGRRAEPEALRQGAAHRSADGDGHGRGWQGEQADRLRAGHRAGADGVPGNHQGMGHERRRLLQRQQRASVRESDADLQFPGDVRHFRDLGRADLHARPDDRLPDARLGGLGGDGVPLSRRRDHRLLGRGGRQPDDQGGSDRVGAVARREHGGQGDAIRDRELGALRDGHDRRELRRREFLARLLHAHRRDGAARQHHARRGDLRRRGRRACTASSSSSSCRSSSPG